MFSVALAGLLFACSLHPVPAADKTWVAGGDQFSWSSDDNWNPAGAPVANDALFFGGNLGTFNNNDLAADTDFTGITFNAGADPFTLIGNEVDMVGGVTNNSANLQTITLNLDHSGANRTYVAAGDLLLDGAVKNNAMIKLGPGTITLGGALDNSSLRAEVYEGVLILAKESNRSLGGSPIVATNAGTIRIFGPGTDQIHFNQRINVELGGTLDVQNTEEIGTLGSIGAVGGTVLNNSGVAVNLNIGGGRDHRGIFGGSIQDGTGVLNLQLARDGHVLVLNGTNTYTGTTFVQDNRTDGAAYGTRLIVNGQHTGGGAYTISSSSQKAHLGGSGSISAAVVDVNAGGAISPGGTLSANSDAGVGGESTATLTINNNVNFNDATSILTIELNGTIAGSGYDQVIVGGSGALFNNGANLKLTLGFTAATGDKFTIVQVQGTDPANNTGVFASLNGVATDLSQGATFVEPLSGKNFRISYRAEGSTFDAGEGSGNDIMLEVVAPVGGKDVTWRGSAANNDWDVLAAGNWWDGANLVTFENLDFVTFDDSGSNHVPVNLVGDLTPSTLLVNATKDYVFAGSGKLTGTVVMMKTNTGTLSIVTDNDPIGSTTIQSGTLQLGTNGVTGSLTGVIAVNSNGVLAHNRSDDVTISTPAFSGTGGFVHRGDGQLTITGEIPFAGKTTNAGALLQFGDGASLAGSIGGEVNVPAGRNVRYFYSNGQKDVPNSLSGSGTVEYDSSLGGTLRIAGTAVSSNFTGTANLIAGTRLWASDNNNGYAFGNGSTINVPDFSQVWMDRSATPYNQVLNIAGNGYAGDFPELGALRLFGAVLNGEINLLADSRIGGTISSATIYAPIKGSFRLEVLGNADYQLNMGPTNALHTYASTLVTRGWINALNSNAISTGPLTLDVAGGLRLNGNNLTVASLSDTVSGLVTGDGARVHNNHGSASATLTVGTDNSSTTFNGVFGNGNGGALGLTKVGSGTLTLTAASTNTGPVTVEGGTLALIEPASFASAAVISAGNGATFDVMARADQTLTLNSGQTLMGNGTIAGTVNALAGSTVNPGASVGTLTVSGDLTLAGQLVMELNRTNAPQTSDQIAVSGTFNSASGTLAVSNVGPALVVGDFFQLFGAGRSFASVVLSTDDIANRVQYTWENTVASNGRITVLSVTPTVDPTPTNITVTVTGGNLDLSWPASHIGWSLQAQTNALNVGLSGNWTTLGYENTNAVSLPINRADPAVFFRLFLP